MLTFCWNLDHLSKASQRSAAVGSGQDRCNLIVSSLWISWRLLCSITFYWCSNRNGIRKINQFCSCSVQSYTSSFRLGSSITASIRPGWKRLAGVCQVPLTAILLLFELTQYYRIVLPLLGAVGLSSWITSGQTRRKVIGKTKKLKQGNTSSIQQPEVPSPTANGISSSGASAQRTSNASDLCEFESSLCIDDAVSLMLAEKQPCAMIVDDDHILIGLLTLTRHSRVQQ